MRTPIDDETLVAFLDGELPEEQRETLELQIGSDPELKQRVDGLRQTWDLLVDLPAEKPNPDLTRSTIELVTLDLEQQETNHLRRLLGNRIFQLGMGGLLALVAGAAASLLVSTFRANTLQENLPYIADFEALQEVDSAAWIDELRSIEHLTEAFPGKSLGEEAVPLKDFSAKKEWIEQLDPAEQGLLRDNFLAFRALDHERIQRIKSIANSFNDDPQIRTDSLQAIRSYAAMLDSYPSNFAIQLKRLKIPQRREQVQKLVLQKMKQLFPSKMSEQDRNTIAEWAFNESLYDLRELDFIEEQNLPESSIRALLGRLSDEANALLRVGLSEDEPTSEEDRFTLGTWVAAAVMNSYQASSSPDNLLAKLSDLGDELDSLREKQRIRLLPEETAREELKRLSGPGIEGPNP